MKLSINNFFSIWVILIICFVNIQAGKTIKGQVIDAKTTKPLTGVNIFFSNTKIGTTSDKEGFFIIEKPDNIQTPLIFQHIGYEIVEKDPARMPVTAQIISLEPSAVALQPVYISSENSWLKNYKRKRKVNTFLDKFYLNKDISELYCDVKNTEYLQFKYSPPYYEVSCDTLLIVHNDYLGYRLNIAIKKFNWTVDNIHFKLEWEYFINYQELIPEDDNQLDNWEENRNFIYKGTFRHFIKTLIEGNSRQKGFKIFDSKKVIKTNFNQGKTALDSEFSIDANYKLKKAGYRSLDFNDVFSVEEKRDSYEIEYNLGSEYLIVEYKNYIKAFIQFGTYKIFSDPYGNVPDRNFIMIGGDWQQYGVESLLPMDFIPTE